MVRHFFLDKAATLLKGSRRNSGLNPILELNYGKNVSRGIIHFDETPIVNLVNDKTFADLDKLHINLRMTNCFSVDGLPYEKSFMLDSNNVMQRATSFDIMAFKLPQTFDAGRGFNFISDFWIRNNQSVNEHGASWYFAEDGNVWEVDKDKVDLSNPMLNMVDGNYYILEEDGVKNKILLEGGIYSTEFIKSQIELYNSGEKSIIIGKQHFDFGNENLNICITDYVKDILAGEHNYGIGLMFYPSFEAMEVMPQQYVGFFTDNTNTFFHPYVEVVYDEPIMDDRANFCIGKENRLYLYSNIGGEPCNLDEIPSCEVNGVNCEVKQAQKGVYYALISPSEINLRSNAIYYDNWSKMALNGEIIDDVELEFSTKPKESFLQIGSNSAFKDMMVPSVYGINFDEKLHRGEEREVVVDFRKKYTTDKKELIDSAEYKLYIKDGNRELDVIDYTPIEKAFLNNFFVVYTEDLIPNEYFVDIKVKHGRETRYYKEVLKFKVASDVTERYE